MFDIDGFFKSVPIWTKGIAAVMAVVGIPTRTYKRFTGVIEIQVGPSDNSIDRNKVLEIRNVGKATAKDVRVEIDRASLTWGVCFLDSEVIDDNTAVISIDQLGPGETIKRLIPLAFQMPQSTVIRGSRSWKDFKPHKPKIFEIRPNL